MRILIIEDEHKIAQAIKRGLEQETYAVDVEYTAPEGLAAALVHNYDLIILDRMLPGIIDGLEICRTLRQKDIHTPILVLSAKDKIENKVEGLNHGADDYLVKPFAFEELLARVRALLRRPTQSLPTVLTVDNLSLDLTGLTVQRDQKTIQLSNKEFALLEFLMRHPGQIVTKEQLINRVWDFDADVLYNTVEVYIGYLRKKIDLPGEKKLIQTVRGFGYKFGGLN